jgi:putative sigma-54 modulation protein
MTLEEAVMEMDLMNQDFLVFKNAETDEINVIYHRRDGHVGLIEP